LKKSDTTKSPEDPDIPQQSFLHSATLHLLPGVLNMVLFVIIAPILFSLGYPSNLALLLAVLFVLVPFELGLLFYQGKKRNDTLSLDGIVLYREPMSLTKYVLFAAILLLYANFILVVVYPPIAQMLIKTLFFWLPDWFFMSSLLTYSKPLALITALLGLVVNGFVAPITEELYFRGYLLPRISHFRAWAPVFNGVLHSLYHFWMPWQVPGLILGLLPAAFVVWWKRNIYLGMIIHVMGNTLGSILTLVTILSLS
jgi:membrane protease YdiL (CAAX protease family)